ncbi:MAG: hypothetical protein J6C93_07760 [Clostridia bacterium]|nr:hypothetical protein [Clostridia bacterium]
MRGKTKTVHTALALFLAVAGIFPAAAPSHYSARAEEEIPFEERAVEDDLEHVDPDLYPLDEKGRVSIVNFTEYAYSLNALKSEKYAVYLYVYNPTGQEITTRENAHVVNMAISYKSDGTPEEYRNLSLTLLDASDDWRFLKFRLTNSEGALERVRTYAQAHAGVRRYDFAGIQLHGKGEAKATDHPLSATYYCTGYSHGYGADSTAASTLSVRQDVLETVELEIHQTYYRTGLSDLGAGHYNQLSSVYFSVPSKKIESYGGLYAVKCEWDERKTTPIIVTNDADIYSDVLAHVGTTGEGAAYSIYDQYHSSGSPNITSARWGYNVGEDFIISNDQRDVPVGYVFQSSLKDVLDAKVTSEEIIEWIRARNYADYLFLDDVDEGRTYGEQEKTFYADEPFDMISFETTGTWFEKFAVKWRDFWNGTETDLGQDYLNVPPIYNVTEKDFAGTDSANAQALFVNDSDIGDLERFYEKEKDENDVFLLRFAVTDYYAAQQTVLDPEKLIQIVDDESTYMAQETMFLDFDVIELTFKKGKNETVIPVVANPIDVVGAVENPVEADDTGMWVFFGTVAFLILGGALIIGIQVDRREE